MKWEKSHTHKHKRFNEVWQVCLHPWEQSDSFYFLFINNRVTSQYIISRVPWALPVPSTCFVTQQQVTFSLSSNIFPTHKIWVMHNNLHLGEYSALWKINSKSTLVFWVGGLVTSSTKQHSTSPSNAWTYQLWSSWLTYQLHPLMYEPF